MKNAGDFMKNAGARSVLRDTTGFQRANTKGKLLRTNSRGKMGIVIKTKATLCGHCLNHKNKSLDSVENLNTL